MLNKKELLEELATSVLEKENEGLASKAALGLSAVAGYKAGVALVNFFTPKDPRAKIGSRPYNVTQYAKDLLGSTSDQTAALAVLGLLSVSARVLLRFPELRDLGHIVRKVTLDQRFDKYISGSHD